MLIGAFLFQPIRNWIQERLDRISTATATITAAPGGVRARAQLGRPIWTPCCVGGRAAAEDALHQAPGFLPGGGEVSPAGSRSSGCAARWATIPAGRRRGADLDLSFLNWKLPEPYLFFERTHHQLDAVSRSWPASVRRTIADLDLTYYLPCTVRGRTIAYLGVSRTTDGDYLSSVDVELLPRWPATWASPSRTPRSTARCSARWRSTSG
jgi:two-component system, NtrC family, sensor kinase